MAKQSGIHQLRGKVRGMSYYRQKGVSDGLARSINQGMSERVKNDAGYLNTRLNAREFGSAGSFAGAAIRAISDRQRTMLKDFATGALAKAVKALIAQDSTNPWGERQLVGTDWQTEMLSRIGTYAKNDFISYVGGAWDTSVAATEGGQTWTPNAELSEGWGSLLAAKGATGAIVEMYAYLVELQDAGEYSGKGFSQVAIVGREDITIGTAGTIVEPSTVGTQFDGAQGDNKMQGVLVVVKPYQEVNGTKYVRQELCTFALYPVTTA